jgi:hypothetical protein
VVLVDRANHDLLSKGYLPPYRLEESAPSAIPGGLAAAGAMLRIEGAIVDDQYQGPKTVILSLMATS